MNRRVGTSWWQHSLQARVLVATAGVAVLALVLTGWTLHHLFRRHVEQQFQAELTRQLHQVMARLTDDPSGPPAVKASLLSDPRWTQPYGGLYWQLQGPDGVVLQRSRSLWDQTLVLPHDTVADGVVHRHRLSGPDGSPLLVLEQSVWRADADSGGPRWTLAVGASTAEQERAVADFSGALVASLSALAGLLGLGAWAQLWFGLAPLRALSRAVQQLNSGAASRLQGQWPSEVQPLANGFNQALTNLDNHLHTARTQAGNLAHALKTPLAVMRHAAEQAPTEEWAQVIQDQVSRAQRQVDWHLRRARSAALAGQGRSTRCDAVSVAQGLQRVMVKVHTDSAIDLVLQAPPSPLWVAVDEQDLHEMLGNLMDNAFRWAHGRVDVTLSATETQVRIRIRDDGPGIGDTLPEQLLQRGHRLDESTPGSGLGLSIVQELATLYRGHLRLESSTAPASGLCATLELPKG